MRKLLTAAAITAAALAVLAPTAMSKAGDVKVRGTCTMHGKAKLKVQPRNSRLKIKFEVEHVAPGQAWNVTVTDNAVGVISGQRTTDADGQFEAEGSTADQAGTDSIQATATNTVTGETCTASASL